MFNGKHGSKDTIKEKQMKKILLAISFAVMSVSAAFAHGEGDNGAHHHGGLRHFTSPEINVMEYENNFSGYFHGSYINMSPNKKQDGYEGYVIFNGNKINAEMKAKEVKGKDGKKKNTFSAKFGDISFEFDSLDARNGVYTFRKGEEKNTVSVIFEYRKGPHMINPVFVVKNNNRSYIVRMEGEACYMRSLWYSMMIYGMSNFDTNPPAQAKQAAKDADKKEPAGTDKEEKKK